MTHRDFVYWLKGFEELHKVSPNDEEWNEVKKHLQTCFNCEPPVQNKQVDFMFDKDGHMHIQMDPQLLWRNISNIPPASC